MALSLSDLKKAKKPQVKPIQEQILTHPSEQRMLRPWEVIPEDTLTQIYGTPGEEPTQTVSKPLAERELTVSQPLAEREQMELTQKAQRQEEPLAEREQMELTQKAQRQEEPLAEREQSVYRPSTEREQSVYRPSTEREQTVSQASTHREQTVYRPSTECEQTVSKPLAECSQASTQQTVSNLKVATLVQNEKKVFEFISSRVDAQTRETDFISTSELKQATGLGSDQLRNIILRLKKKGIVRVVEGTLGGPGFRRFACS
jgi:hypothetical protein